MTLKRYLLYNPLCGNGRSRDDAELLLSYYGGEGELIDMTALDGYKELFERINEEDTVTILGGDGTLNRFVCDTVGLTLKCPVYYHACGTGNDFLRDVASQDLGDPIEITRYLKDLPCVTVKGRSYRFLNNVGFGIDGYCCEEGDRLRALSDKPVNYTAIAIKGLLFRFKPRRAAVMVDGITYRFENVWIAPTMKGRYYGGGMIPTPSQNRLDPDGTLSVMVFHGKSKLKTLMIFPKIFKGEHIKHEKAVTVLTGKEITVAFDEPTPLQIDGETFTDVTEYTVTAGGDRPAVAVPDYAEFCTL
jgi:diacylglycerol kinase family enzyme